MNITFHGMNLGQIALWFFIYSFLGWAMECIVIRKQLGRWENRGFAKLPFCVIYGFGVFIALNLFEPIKDNYVALYFFGAMMATLLEYATAMVMLKLFGEIWWNYDHQPFNYKGILCLQSTLGWGLLALIVFGFLNSGIEGLVLSIDSRIASAIGCSLMVMYIIDFTYHFTKRMTDSDDAMAECDEASDTHENLITQIVTRIKRR